MNFDFLLRNRFIQSLGVGAFFYLVLMGLNWALLFFLKCLETFSFWYRYHAAPYAFQISVGIAVSYLLVNAVFNSRQNI